MSRFFVFTACVLTTTAARAADIGTTYAFSPDLAKEGNSLMAALGFPGIIILNLVILAVCWRLVFYWYRYPLAYQLPKEADSVSAFASLNYFGDERFAQNFPYRFVTRNPKNWRMCAQMAGIQLCVILSVGSGLAVLSWFAIHAWGWDWYNGLYAKTNFVFPYILIVPFYLLATKWYFATEHNRTIAENGRQAE